MFASPRVVAIDDNQRHLDGLVNSLQSNGVACLPIFFTGDPSVIRKCPDVRVIFADLNLINSPSNYSAQFTTLGGLLEQGLAPHGPYFILLWTHYPDQAPALAEFLDKRLEGVTKPFAVVPLKKADHLDDDGKVTDERRLMASIDTLIKEQPQMGAVIDWEARVFSAAGDTVASLLKMASTGDSSDRNADAGRILSQLGIAAVGKKHVDDDRFRAVNEALLPILADRIASLRSSASSADLWQAAFDSPSRSQALTPAQAAHLNSMVHLDTGAGASERGVVIPMPQDMRRSFQRRFGLDEPAAGKQFHCAGFAQNDARFRWVLVQTQAACDYAQSRPGPAPCYLGLEMPFPVRRGSSLPAALWSSPAFELGGKVRQLRVSAAFPVSIGPKKFRASKSIYRLREQILNDLIYHMHSHGARPGMLSFRGE